MSGNHSAAEQSRYFAGYEILSTLGQGGMGIVYEARDPALGRIVALKVLRDDLQARPHLVSRFNREAQAIARLNHPNIVHVYSVGAERGIPYIVMECVDGAPLSMVMQRERRLSWDRALDIAGQIADALASAHEAQIIHRDIKPGNILIDDSGHVYVTDFGIAKILTAETQLTADGSLLGTPQYMAPERCQNGEATAASDIYSLGILTFQMITGRLPFEAATPVDLVRKIVSEAPARLRQLTNDAPEDVDRLVAFMIEKKAKDRPLGARALCEAIARVRLGEPLDTHGSEVAAALASFRDTMATPTPHPGPQYVNSATTEERLGRKDPSGAVRGPRTQIRRAAIGVVSLALLTVIGAAAWMVWENRHSHPGAYDPDRSVELWQAPAEVAEFVDEAPGVVLARLKLAGFSVDATGSCGGSSVFVQLAGVPNGGRDGQRAMLSVDPAQRIAALEIPPLAAYGGGSRETAVLLGGGGGAPLGAPLGHSVVLGYGGDGSTGERALTGLASWDVQSHSPRYPLFQAPTSGGGAISAAAIKPDGVTLALGVTASDGTCYLAERDTRATDAASLGSALSERGAPIVRIVYSQDGNRIAFVRDLGNHRRQIWVVSTAASGKDARMLADGAVNVEPNAFSPDRGALLISEMATNGRSAIRLVQIADGAVTSELGEGWAAEWRGSSNRIVLTAPDAKGHGQFWAVSTTSVVNRAQMTYLEDGVAPAFCITQDGLWAVGELAAGSSAPMVLVNLTRAMN